MKKWCVAILLAMVFCVGLGIAFLWLAGFTIADCWHFEGQTSQDTGAGAMVAMRVDTNIKASSTSASRLRIYAKSSRPYHLDIGFYTDAVTTVRTAIVQRATIRYDDGQKVEVVEPRHSKAWAFEKRRTSNWDGKALVYHESLTAGGTLTNCIDRNMPFVVECQGMLLHETGEEVPMSFRWSFRAKKARGIVPSFYLDRPEGTASQFPSP